jgi:hypothetical protein
MTPGRSEAETHFVEKECFRFLKKPPDITALEHSDLKEIPDPPTDRSTISGATDLALMEETEENSKDDLTDEYEDKVLNPLDDEIEKTIESLEAPPPLVERKSSKVAIIKPHVQKLHYPHPDKTENSDFTVKNDPNVSTGDQKPKNITVMNL